MTQEVEPGRRRVRGGWPGPCGQEVEKAEDVAGMGGVLDGSLRGGEAIVGHCDRNPSEPDECACEVGMLGLVLAAAAAGESRPKTGRCGYSPSPSSTVHKDDKWGGVCTGWGCVKVELVEGVGSVGDLHRRRRF